MSRNESTEDQRFDPADVCPQCHGETCDPGCPFYDEADWTTLDTPMAFAQVPVECEFVFPPDSNLSLPAVGDSAWRKWDATHAIAITAFGIDIPVHPETRVLGSRAYLAA